VKTIRILLGIEDLRRELEDRQLGYRLIAVAEGWQMATRAELAPYVRKLFADRATMRLSTAAQETLSIIAYRQPLTRAEIEEIRGVEVIAALETLLEKRLTKVVGRKETVGRPLMYGTTSEFLRHFGLRSLEDLPPLDSFTPATPVIPIAPAAAEESVSVDAVEPVAVPASEVATVDESSVDTPPTPEMTLIDHAEVPTEPMETVVTEAVAEVISDVVVESAVQDVQPEQEPAQKPEENEAKGSDDPIWPQ
jgi:segregation and condensation protein B